MHKFETIFTDWGGKIRMFEVNNFNFKDLLTLPQKHINNLL